VTLPSRLAQSVKTALSLTASTQFRVRARDVVGNWSAWKYGPTVKGYAYQENYPYIRWSSGWTTQANTAWMGEAARTTTTATASSTFNFSGRSVAWVGRKGPDRGLVRVWLDGKVVATVDLRSPTAGSRSVLYAYTWSASGSHSLRIENLATAGSPRADVDAFLVVK
jgi:hypothetical protein